MPNEQLAGIPQTELAETQHRLPAHSLFPLCLWRSAWPIPAAKTHRQRAPDPRRHLFCLTSCHPQPAHTLVAPPASAAAHKHTTHTLQTLPHPLPLRCCAVTPQHCSSAAETLRRQHRSNTSLACFHSAPASPQRLSNTAHNCLRLHLVSLPLCSAGSPFSFLCNTGLFVQFLSLSRRSPVPFPSLFCLLSSASASFCLPLLSSPSQHSPQLSFKQALTAFFSFSLSLLSRQQL